MFGIDDFRYALRLLKKTPGFTLITIAVLAGGLAISLFTYALLNTVLYKDLPLADGHAIVRLEGKMGGIVTPGGALDAFEVQQMREQAGSLEQFGVYTDGSAMLGDQDVKRSMSATWAEWNIFEFTRTQPMLGRAFVPDDSISGAEPIAVISHSLWQSVFAGDSGILDRVVTIDRKPTRIVGVMPEGYSFPVRSQLWLPLSQQKVQPAAMNSSFVQVYARLRSGKSAGAASGELTAALKEVRRLHPQANADSYFYDNVNVTTFQLAQAGGGEGHAVFAVLNLVSLFILLLACVNVGNMLLARTNERLREIAVRVALGAPRWRLMWQMMLESIIICVSGGVLALLLVAWGLKATDVFLHSWSDGLAYWYRWGLDGETVLAAVVFVLIAIALVSALPTFSATRVQSNTLLRDGTRGARGRTSGRISRALVTIQIVLISVVMVVGSALSVIAYRAMNVDPGINMDRLLSVPVSVPSNEDPEEKKLEFYQRLMSELRADRELEAAMVWTYGGESAFTVDQVEHQNRDEYPETKVMQTSDAPVQLAAKLVEGRYFDHSDGAAGPKSAMVSKTLAETYWPGSSAVGRRIKLHDRMGKVTERVVVGVVSDVLEGEGVMRADRRSYTAVYVPFAQSVPPQIQLLVRHAGNEEAARSDILRIVERLNGSVPRPVMSYAAEWQQTILMGNKMTELFLESGLFAVLLALTGIYGLCSNAVVQRTHEIGLRRAIGATNTSIIHLFLTQSSRQLLIGFVISVFICALILYVLSKYAGLGVLVPFFIGLLVVAAVSMLVWLAIFISLRKTLRDEPAVALRYE